MGILYVVVDGLLTVVTGFVSLIDLSTIISSLTSSWGLLPPQIVWIISHSGLEQCLAIIGYAYLARMLLNLIPATDTRLYNDNFLGRLSGIGQVIRFSCQDI
jgi:hypothetical protein